MPGFIHSSPAMTALVEEVYKIRSSDVTVLVTGESGTGKELVSRAIHTLSNRKDKIFVPFNCTAVPKELAEGHLFGYKKGGLPARSSIRPASYARRTAERFFWTRSATCRSTSSRSCSGSCRKARSSRSAKNGR